MPCTVRQSVGKWVAESTGATVGGPGGRCHGAQALPKRAIGRSPQKVRAMKLSALITGPHSVSSHRRPGQTARGILEVGPLRFGH